jgi:phospholipase/carboxylesterase
MSEKIDPNILTFRDTAFRYRPASNIQSRLMLLLHGWTGDENSMWYFASKIPEHISVMIPRGFYLAQAGGYSWHPSRKIMRGYPSKEEFKDSANRLLDITVEWIRENQLNENSIDLVGFSQGAAMAYVMLDLQPDRIRKFGALSGFLPEGCFNSYQGKVLEGKEVFITHGLRDDLVPVEIGRESAALLGKLGARVTYCESEGGHKVGLNCISSFMNFITA